MLSRSLLFVPGNRPDRFQKAFSSGAGSVILDLEDAVSEAHKAEARSAVREFLAAGRQRAIIRINGLDTDWHRHDLELLASPGVSAVMVPKAEQADAIARIASQCPQAAVLPLIETAAGLENASHIGKVRNVERLIFGSVDFQVDLGIDGDDELSQFRSQLVLQSRLARIAGPVDGVCLALQDAQRLDHEVSRAKRGGFTGKLCIHPAQIQAVNLGFRASPAEIERARKIVDAAGRAGGNAVRLDGQMIDRPIIARAETILQEEAEAQAKAGAESQP
jgi:citrate lyase subunit beta/citryl-CoA lyase